jgi:hypothetical protein
MRQILHQIGRHHKFTLLTPSNLIPEPNHRTDRTSLHQPKWRISQHLRWYRALAGIECHLVGPITICRFSQEGYAVTRHDFDFCNFD